MTGKTKKTNKHTKKKRQWRLPHPPPHTHTHTPNHRPFRIRFRGCGEARQGAQQTIFLHTQSGVAVCIFIVFFCSFSSSSSSFFRCFFLFKLLLFGSCANKNGVLPVFLSLSLHAPHLTFSSFVFFVFPPIFYSSIGPAPRSLTLTSSFCPLPNFLPPPPPPPFF